MGSPLEFRSVWWLLQAQKNELASGVPLEERIENNGGLTQIHVEFYHGKPDFLCKEAFVRNF